jgi:hypothetical protein
MGLFRFKFLNGLFLACLLSVCFPLWMQAADDPLADPTVNLDTFGYHTGTITVDDSSIVLPRVSQGSDSVLDVGLKHIAGELNRLASLPLYQGLMLFMFAACAVIGLTWKGKELIYGEKELKDLLLWFVTRFMVAILCFFVAGPRAANGLTTWMNAVSASFSSAIAGKDTGTLDGSQTTINVNVASKIYREIEVNDSWLKALALSDIRKTIDGWTNNNWFTKMLNGSQFSGFDDTLRRGFPYLSYPVSGRVTNATSYNMSTPYQYAGKGDSFSGNFVVPLPFSNFSDAFHLYGVPGVATGDLINGSSITGGSPNSVTTIPAYGNVEVRPLSKALIDAGNELLQAGQVFTAATASGVSDSAAEGVFGDALLKYRLVTAAARSTYVRDYMACYLSAFILGNESSSSDTVVANAGEGDTLAYILSGSDNAASDYWISNGKKVPSEIVGIVDSVQGGVVKLNMQSYDKNGGVVMYILVPIALAIVGFYATVAVYSIPLLMFLWASLFLLPEQLEMSNSLKKTLNWMLVLLLLPIFSMVVVDLSFGFVNAVRAMAMSSAIRPYSAIVTGLTASKIVPGGGWIGTLAALGVGTAAGVAAGTSADYNLFVWVAWIMAFIFIIGMPKIVASIVSGTTGFADALIQKAQMGSVMGGGMAVMGAAGMARGNSGKQGKDGENVGLELGGGGGGGSGGGFKRAVSNINNIFGGGGGSRPGIGGMNPNE